MIGRLNHVAIAVPDLAAASAQYRDTLGARVGAPQDEPDHGVTVVFIELPNTKIATTGSTASTSPAGAPDRPMLRKKGLIAALIAALLVALVWWVIQQGWITRAAMMDFNRR